MKQMIIYKQSVGLCQTNKLLNYNYISGLQNDTVLLAQLLGNIKQTLLEHTNVCNFWQSLF